MSVFDNRSLEKEYIKIRWREPVTSSSLNKPRLGNQPRGFYQGFAIEAEGARGYKVTQSNPINFHGSATDYNQGAYNAVSGYSIAVFEDNIGHSTTVSIPPDSVSGTFSFEFPTLHNTQVVFALDVDFSLSNETAGQVLAVDASEISNNPDYLVIGVTNIPADGVSASSSDIDYYDTTYPRTLPFADLNKYGYMSPDQVKKIENIGPEVDALYCSDNDANVWWRIFGDVGRLDFTGNIYFSLPTEGFRIRVTEDGDVVSGLGEGDVVYFTYFNDGSVSSATLEIGVSGNLPTVPINKELSIFGKRCGNDFWFKNGMKWEVGEFKPFGVTSKSPNLTVGETGNPPVSNNVSGIFFDQGNVTVLPGGRDVRIFVNVSGSRPEDAIEQQFVVSGVSQSNFTANVSGLYWTFDHTDKDVQAFRNGVKLIQYTDTTSGITLSDGVTPIWDFKKSGTRSIELASPAPTDAVITLRLEADKGINADEEVYVVSGAGAQFIYTTREFNSSNAIPDIKVYRNGQKQQFYNGDTLYNPLIHNCIKNSNTEIEFFDFLNKDDVITVRYESVGVTNTTAGGGGGINWADPVDANIVPQTDNVYDIGSPAKQFKNGYFKGDFYIGGKLNVSGGIDPLYLQLEPIASSEAPLNSIFIDSAGLKFSVKDNSGIVNDFGTGGGGSTSGINFEETEVMVNPYPFAIEAPKAVSISTSGNFFLLTDYNDANLTDNFFGILTENVSAYGSGSEDGYVQWRGKVPLIGYNNGKVYVSGQGEIVETVPSVSGQSILNLGIVKSSELFLRPRTSISL